MKIDGTNPLSGNLGFGEEAPSSVQERSGTGSEEGAELRISLGQNNIQSLKAQLDKLPDVRQNKMQALQRAVQNGSYEVDNYQLADAIWAEFFGPGKSSSS